MSDDDVFKAIHEASEAHKERGRKVPGSMEWSSRIAGLIVSGYLRRVGRKTCLGCLRSRVVYSSREADTAGYCRGCQDDGTASEAAD
jgi:hypothetical protein